MRGYFVFPITTKYNESAGVPQNVVLVTCDSESEDLWNTILNKIFRVYQMENRKSKGYEHTPFSFFTVRTTLDSRYFYEDLDERLKHGSVIIS